MKREANQTQERFYNKHTCREVSPGLDAPSLAGLTEPATMFGFYHMPFR
jgi:hypothetical protein